MKSELEYPFIGKKIISNKKRLIRELSSDGKSRLDINIALLGGFTTGEIKDCIELFLMNQGIKPHFFESDYNQYKKEALSPSESFARFNPDVIYICTSNRNVSQYPKLGDNKSQVRNLLKHEYGEFELLWRSLKKKFGCIIIQNNFEKPFYRLLGNKDASDFRGKVNYLTELNRLFYEYSQSCENFYICDIDYISADYGLKNWYDLRNWYMYKYAMSLDAIPYLSFNVSNIIKSVFGKNKKGFVLDLDNTLWGGVIGEDGIDHVEIGQGDAVGEAYTEFQSYLKEQESIGIILNVSSKNDEKEAILGLRHPDCILRPEDMVVIKANWEPKDKNLTEIAKEVNLAPESLVFVDDNPAERELIKRNCPDVPAPDIGQVTDYIGIIDRSGYFESTLISEEDKNRVDKYKSNIKRATERSGFKDYREYLKCLEMRATILPFDHISAERITQLCNKSNQFNLTTKRLTYNEIYNLIDNDRYITLYGRLTDKFGDNGIVSIVIGDVIDNKLDIEVFLMSCRVLKRDMEYAMIDEIVRKCRQRDIKNIEGHYYPTEKNSIVKDFYRDCGFKKKRGSNADWIVETEQYQNKNSIIRVNE